MQFKLSALSLVIAVSLISAVVQAAPKERFRGENYSVLAHEKVKEYVTKLGGEKLKNELTELAEQVRTGKKGGAKLSAKELFAAERELAKKEADLLERARSSGMPKEGLTLLENTFKDFGAGEVSFDKNPDLKGVLESKEIREFLANVEPSRHASLEKGAQIYASLIADKSPEKKAELLGNVKDVGEFLRIAKEQLAKEAAGKAGSEAAGAGKEHGEGAETLARARQAIGNSKTANEVTPGSLAEIVRLVMLYGNEKDFADFSAVAKDMGKSWDHAVAQGLHLIAKEFQDALKNNKGNKELAAKSVREWLLKKLGSQEELEKLCGKVDPKTGKKLTEGECGTTPFCGGA